MDFNDIMQGEVGRINSGKKNVFFIWNSSNKDFPLNSVKRMVADWFFCLFVCFCLGNLQPKRNPIKKKKKGRKVKVIKKELKKTKRKRGTSLTKSQKSL